MVEMKFTPKDIFYLGGGLSLFPTIWKAEAGALLWGLRQLRGYSEMQAIYKAYRVLAHLMKQNKGKIINKHPKPKYNRSKDIF